MSSEKRAVTQSLSSGDTSPDGLATLSLAASHLDLAFLLLKQDSSHGRGGMTNLARFTMRRKILFHRGRENFAWLAALLNLVWTPHRKDNFKNESAGGGETKKRGAGGTQASRGGGTQASAGSRSSGSASSSRSGTTSSPSSRSGTPYATKNIVGHLRRTLCTFCQRGFDVDWEGLRTVVVGYRLGLRTAGEIACRVVGEDRLY